MAHIHLIDRRFRVYRVTGTRHNGTYARYFQPKTQPVTRGYVGARSPGC